MNKIFPTARNANIVIQELETELLLYDLKLNQAFCLNETSALVWQLCDGKNLISDISRLMSRKLKIDVPEEFVRLALDGLKKDSLLEKGEEFEIDFNGLTRRQIVKKIGLASMIALPLISSVTAPQALSAQSGLPITLGGFCSPTSSRCESGSCISVLNGSFGSEQRCCFSGTTNAPGFSIGCVLASVCDFLAPNCCNSMTVRGSCSIPGSISCSCQ